MEHQKLSSIIVYCDGACTGNPGPGGWASIVATPDGHVDELGGFEPETTNNRMEILAVIKALQFVREETTLPMIIYTDSVYTIRGITEWIWAWRKRNWKTAEGADVSNQDLWQQLFSLANQRKNSGLEWKFVRGHSGNPGNERCDEIAVAFSKQRKPNLYHGPLLKYDYPIYDLPPDLPLPEMRAIEPKKAAYSYLSLLGSSVMRHKSWSGCELRVKGRSGAKFKKAMSQEEEDEIIKSWGLDPKKIKIEEDPR